MFKQIGLKEKIIRDSVHGYISLPEGMFDLLIDTPIFQRLRRIEQTSMRSLYPAAHHDRFIHSLGTYHLGRNAVDALYANLASTKYYFEEDSSFWDKYKFTFSIACLLHDCAHSPFSHSFEYLYFYDGGKDIIRESFLSYWHDSKKNGYDEDRYNIYMSDIMQYFDRKPNPHESASALVVALYFEQKIRKLLELYNFDYNPSDIEFIQRAIMGVKYRFIDDTAGVVRNILEDMEYRHKNIENCMIDLLNAQSFDVDKLDYIIRDSVESGIDNISVDVERLIKSLVIVEKHEFATPTDIDTKFNNSFVFSSIEGNVDYINEISELNIALDGGVKIQGHLNGTINFLPGDAKNSYTIYDKSGNPVESPKQYEGVKEFIRENKMEAIISKGAIKGGFLGTVSSTTGVLDGEMNCHLKGRIVGVIIGHIESKDLGKTTLEIGYRSSAINIIEDIVIARNRLYLWIYAHQKVTYTDYTLRQAAIYAFAKRSDKFNATLPLLEQQSIGNSILSEAVSVQSLLDKASSFYLFEDSDIYSEMKKPANTDIISVDEYLTRQHKFVVWKSYADFNTLFSNLSDAHKRKIWLLLFNADLSDEMLSFTEGDNSAYNNSILNHFASFKDIQFAWIKPSGIKLAELNADDTYVAMNFSVKRLKDVMVRTKITEQFTNENFFYLYSSKELSSIEKSALIGELKKAIQ